MIGSNGANFRKVARRGLGIATALALVLAIPARSQAPHAAEDQRQLVKFPDAMRVHVLANMRDHLQALQEINAALSKGEFENAGAIAEKRLGMTSLEAHGASHVARFMPQAMQDIGSGMHRAASRFAIEAQNASATSDLRSALAALNPVLQQCAACHAAYRLQ